MIVTKRSKSKEKRSQMAKVMSNTTNINENGNEQIENSHNVLNHLKSVIRPRANNEVVFTNVESVNNIPKRVKNLQPLNEIHISRSNENNPRKNTYLINQKDLSPLFKSPAFKKWDKSARSVDKAQTNTRKGRTISANSDCDTFRMELSDVENCSNFEHIALVHDLDSVIKLEDSRDILMYSMMDTTQEDDGLSGVDKDPVTDPLFISDCEMKNTDTDSYSNSNRRRSLRLKLMPQTKRQECEYHLKTPRYKSKMKKEQELENFQEFEEMPLIDLKKLLELRIKLIHKVPQQHKIELSGSHAPTREEKMLFQRYGPIRNGLYRPTEDEIIRTNWTMFCKLHDWNPKTAGPFLHWRHNGRYYINNIEERQKFVQFLANGLPWRTLHSVYSRFKILYCNKITHTRYTPKEDKKILRYIQNRHLDGRDVKYTELAKLLRRTSRSIVKRCRYLENQTQDKSITDFTSLVDVKWTLPLIKKFIVTLMSVTLSEDIRELENATLPKSVWQKMEKKLNIHENVLRTFWHHQLHLQLFSTGPIYLNDIKIQLIEYMYAKGISSTREIIWPNVAQYFDGVTSIFLCKVFYYLVQECDKKDMNNFADIVEHLYHTKIREIKDAPTDKFLPKIIYENGKVFLLDT